MDQIQEKNSIHSKFILSLSQLMVKRFYDKIIMADFDLVPDPWLD